MSDRSSLPSHRALSFEAVKTAMRQTKDGYALTLVLHPNDVPPGLFADPVGQVYMIAAVPLDNSSPREEPRPQEKPVDKSGEDAVRYAGILCREPGFQAWIVGLVFGSASFVSVCEADAVSALRQYLGVKSRADIAHNPDVRDKFNQLVKTYRQDIGL